MGYGQTYHFKGPHDSIGEVVRRRVVIIKDVKHFFHHADSILKTKVVYLDSLKVKAYDLDDTAYIRFTSKIFSSLGTSYQMKKSFPLVLQMKDHQTCQLRKIMLHWPGQEWCAIPCACTHTPYLV